jgi:hypothetical protein
MNLNDPGLSVARMLGHAPPRGTEHPNVSLERLRPGLTTTPAGLRHAAALKAANSTVPPTNPEALAAWLIAQAFAVKDTNAEDPAAQPVRIAKLLKMFQAYLSAHRKLYDANDQLQSACLQLLTDSDDVKGPP